MFQKLFARFAWFAWLECLIDALFPPRATELLVRKATFADLKALCRPQAVVIDGLRVTALLPYRVPLVQALVTEAKYENNQQAQALLGEVLADYIKVRLVPALRPHENLVVVPLPLGKARQKERGYNQVEEIAKCAQGFVRFSLVADILVRIRETVPQTSLGREDRQKNMRGAFGARSDLDPSTTYILLDDVVTTGATLLAAHDALFKAGVTRIITLALAH